MDIGHDEQAFACRIIRASGAPLLLIDEQLRVVAASAGFLRTFADHAPEGRLLDEITGGAWTEARVQDLLQHVRQGEPGASVETQVICPEGPRRVRVQVEPTFPDAHGACPLVMSIEDVTDFYAREAVLDSQLREAAALLQEAHHRTANNLSMISSILSMKARSVELEETRSELESARRRVLAMATIERHLQLAETDTPTTVRPYLQALCRQLSASLVGEMREIAIRVQASAGAQPRRTAVILGLVVTELIINALKYAFPGRRGGQILVEYWETPTGWCAAVSDDGAGLRTGQARKGDGLGSGIVAALAAQLGATTQIVSSPAGVRVELCWERRD